MEEKYRESLEGIIEKLKEENPECEIEFNGNQILSINGTEIEVSSLDIMDPKEKDDNKPSLDSKETNTRILFKTKDGYVIIAEVIDNEIMLDMESMKKAGLLDRVDLNKKENKMELRDQEDEEYEHEERVRFAKDAKKDKEQEEQEQEPEQKEEQLPQKDMPKNLVELNDKIIKLLVPQARNYGKMYLNSNGEIVGRNRETGELENVKGIDPIKGTSSNMNIHGTEDKQHKHVNAIRMYTISSRPHTGFAVTRDGSEKGNMDLRFTTRRIGSNDIQDFAYVDLPLLESNEKVGINRARDIAGDRKGPRQQAEVDKSLDKIDEMDMPEKVYEVFDKNLEKEDSLMTVQQLKEILTKSLMESNNMREVTAREIASYMIDENKSFAEAEKTMQEEQEQDFVPGQDPRKPNRGD